MARYATLQDDLCQTDAHTVTASAEDTAYPAANLTTENPAQPAKLTTTSGNWVLDFASAPGDAIAAALIYQYLDGGIEVRIQANDSDSWDSPAFDQTITIPGKRRDGPDFQRWTTSPFVLFDEPQNYRFWRLAIVGTNNQAVCVGRLMLLAALPAVDRFYDGDIGETLRPDDDPGQIVQPTELGVDNIITIGGPRRGLSVTLIASDYEAGSAPVQEASDFRTLCETVDGREHPFLLIPDESRNDAWLVRPESGSWPRAHRVGGYQVWTIPVREVSRGLPWP